jgi:hypothetical protein
VPGYTPGSPPSLVGGTNAVNTVMGDIVRVPGGTGISGAYTGAAYDAAFSTG